MDLLTLAKNVAQRVEAQATQAKVPVAVCVVDVHGNVVLQHRMPGAPLFSLDISGRHDQAFPRLTESEIARIARFGERRQYHRGERAFAAGEPPPGMLVVLKGTLTMSSRDGLGHVVPIVRHDRGNFTGEVAQLS